jgi:hypothetical protein
VSRWRLPAATALALTPTGASACAVCVGGVGESGTAGFYWSALLLTALPFAVIAAIGAWVSRAGDGPRRRAGDTVSEDGARPPG